MLKRVKNVCAAIISAVLMISVTCTANAEFTTGGLEDCRFLDEYDINTPSYSTYGLFTAKSKSLPLTEYPKDTYFSVTGKECTCHKKNCSYSGGCDCRVYESSIQCAGFARYVYNEYHDISVDMVTKNYINANINKTSAYNYLRNVSKGTFIKVKAVTSDSTLVDHFMIITKTTDDYIRIYHANYGGKCRVRYQQLPYEKFSKLFPYIYYTA